MAGRNQPFYVVNGDPTSAGWFAPLILNNDGDGPTSVSFTIKPVSGTVNGQFKVQITDLSSNTQAQTPVSADWVDVPDAVAPASSGAISVSQAIILRDFPSRWVRLVFTDGSSSSPRVDVGFSMTSPK